MAADTPRSEEIGLHNLKPKPGSKKRRKRIGRGEGSKGKTSGRGHGGAGSRAGAKEKAGYEGGQNPINLVKATMDGLIRLRRPEEVAELRGLTVSQVLGLTTDKGTNDGEHLAPLDGAAAAGPVADEAPSSSQAAGEDTSSAPPAGEAALADAAGAVATEEAPPEPTENDAPTTPPVSDGGAS